jgi:hypothetical protein
MKQEQSIKLALMVGLFSLKGFTGAVSYYGSYLDGKCVDEFTVKGKFVLSSDDYDYASCGYMTRYYGGCLYLVDGVMDHAMDLEKHDRGSSESNYYLHDYVSYYDYGTCVECNGVVGCSPDGTCSNFKTLSTPTVCKNYQRTQDESSRMQTKLSVAAK